METNCSTFFSCTQCTEENCTWLIFSEAQSSCAIAEEGLRYLGIVLPGGNCSAPVCADIFCGSGIVVKILIGLFSMMVGAVGVRTFEYLQNRWMRRRGSVAKVADYSTDEDVEHVELPILPWEPPIRGFLRRKQEQKEQRKQNAILEGSRLANTVRRMNPGPSTSSQVTSFANPLYRYRDLRNSMSDIQGSPTLVSPSSGLEQSEVVVIPSLQDNEPALLNIEQEVVGKSRVRRTEAEILLQDLEGRPGYERVTQLQNLSPRNKK